MTRYRNPAHLVGLERSQALARLLRACGAGESCITGKASDYERFAALAAALPLCKGHPEATRVQELLTREIGLTAPLCPHTAHAYWQTWVDRYWLEREGALPTLPDRCPLCVSCAPTAWKNPSLLPDPMTASASNLDDWSEALRLAWTEAGEHPRVVLPEDYDFVRPNPYHANLAIEKLYAGEALTVRERDLLWTQALRVWGLLSLRDSEQGRKIPILLGGSPSAVTSLLAYLSASGMLSSLVWIPRDPAHAGLVSGLYATVQTGYVLPIGCSPTEREAVRKVYSTIAPLGTAIETEM